MIKVLINGINGKMGREVVNQIKNKDDFYVVAGVDTIDLVNSDFPIYSNTSKILETPDVIIDFSRPEATMNILKYASSKHIPIVIATTGFSDEELNTIKKYSNTIPIFKSANMSYETNIMVNLVSKLAIMLKDSDIEIIETHHNKKVDSPSGTALLLADSINNSLNNEMNYEYDRHSKKQARTKNEIGIHSIRGGTEVGKHTVLFFGDNETLELTHNVNSRSVFANGALKASKFIINKTPGLYGMNDLINL